jgi:tetratricopeptide (TPR) repeat protein
MLGTVLWLGLLAGCATTEGGAPLRGSARLDDLFSQLRSTASDEEAHRIEVAILRVWTVSGRPEVDLLMMRASAQANMGDLGGALDSYDQAALLAPDFAEIYDQRALIHAMRDEYGPAITDLQHVLTLEPRHFAALTGLGHILLLYDEDEAALHVFQAALAINPHLASVREEVDQLKEKLAGVPI